MKACTFAAVVSSTGTEQAAAAGVPQAAVAAPPPLMGGKWVSMARAKKALRRCERDATTVTVLADVEVEEARGRSTRVFSATTYETGLMMDEEGRMLIQVEDEHGAHEKKKGRKVCASFRR